VTLQQKTITAPKETCEVAVFVEASQGFQKQQSCVKLLLYIQELYDTTGNSKIPVGKEPTDRKIVFILSVSIKPTEK
jgi:hypothetical protein